VLHEDGRFEEEFTTIDGHVITSEGTWRQDRVVRPTRVHLSAALVRPMGDDLTKQEWEFVVVKNGRNGAELQATPDPDGSIVLERR